MTVEFFSWAALQYAELRERVHDQLGEYEARWDAETEMYPDDGDNAGDSATYRSHVHQRMQILADHFEVPPIARSAYDQTNHGTGRIQSWFVKIDVDAAVDSLLAAVTADCSESRVYRPKVLERANVEVMKWLQARPSDIDRVHHRSFESIVAEVLRAKGWHVELTKQTRDGGYDILALRTDAPGFPIKIIVECKLYHLSRPVGVPMVDRLVGVGLREHASQTMLVTNSRFTKMAWRSWQENIERDLRLVDRAELFEWLQSDH